MIKRLLVLTVVLIVLSFGSVYAAQLDGMVSGDTWSHITGPDLPDDLSAYVNPSGLGDVLIYPYYNVRGNKVTYFNIVNTDTVNGVLVKLRFREAATIAGAGPVVAGKAKTGCVATVDGFFTAGDPIDCGSNEVLDFAICLSHGDVYTGAIVSDASGAGKFVSLDTDTATIPTVPAGGVIFRSGADAAINGITADNTREGYFEVLAYGIWDDTEDCDGTTTGVNAPNRLGGVAFIHDEDTNATYAYNATAIANCRSALSSGAFGWFFGNDQFILDNCTDSTGTDDATNGTDHVDQVDYVLTKVNIGQMYYVDPTLKGRTDFIITFPTKRLNDVYHDGYLFSNPTVIFEVWDDKENSITASGDFSPSTTKTNSLPHEVNVLNIKTAHNGMFTSDVDGEIGTSTFTYGWIAIDLTGGDLVADGVSDTDYMATGWVTYGLPGIGLVFQDAQNEAMSWALPMKYATYIDDTTGAVISP